MTDLKLNLDRQGIFFFSQDFNSRISVSTSAIFIFKSQFVFPWHPSPKATNMGCLSHHFMTDHLDAKNLGPRDKLIKIHR